MSGNDSIQMSGDCQTGFCLDDPGSSTTDGTQLDISACTGGDNQVWNLPTS